MAHEGLTTTEIRDDRAVDVREQDLPVYCPNPRMPLWSSHPRVYLDIAETGEAMCPYCGTRYRLAGGPLRAGGD
jgi:uncharacterized Zn-finger protein